MIRRVSMTLLASFAPALPGPLAAACPEIGGAEELLGAGRVVLLGEMHGTEESPAFLAALACRAVEAGLAVRVGLEIDVAEAAAIEAFLASRGEPGDLDALLAGPFWTRGYQDGRSSRAMAGLLAELGDLRRRGHAVAVFPFSDETAGARRDAAMAETIAARLDDPEDTALTLVLTGNLHSRRSVGSPWDPAFEPMGYLLAAVLPGRQIVALDVCHPGGDAWICTGAEASECGARTVGANGGEADAVPAVLLQPGHEAGHHDGAYCVGTLHASAPAVTGSDSRRE